MINLAGSKLERELSQLFQKSERLAPLVVCLTIILSIYIIIISDSNNNPNSFSFLVERMVVRCRLLDPL